MVHLALVVASCHPAAPAENPPATTRSAPAVPEVDRPATLPPTAPLTPPRCLETWAASDVLFWLNRQDAPPPSTPPTWEAPADALVVGKRVAALEAPLLALLAPDAGEDHGPEAVTVRYAGLVDRPLGRTRAFTVRGSIEHFTEGMCHSIRTTFRFRGTLYLAERTPVLVELDLHGPARSRYHTCPACGDNGDQPCASASPDQREARVSMRRECEPR